ncbi:S41 family peptidase [Aliikangiella sp. G2MR2-5]|uniref:S41 family peptidase n=1 Tax=Aliikangiella sp. G2MR2-5 TaxID=2788943 RepID=UPI0018ABC552|nr:S41 family peptidase [Aliikangiella sp. G2MR2-5]
MKLKLYAVALLTGLSGVADASVGYYRSPSLHNNTLVFTAEGDLWINQIGSTESRRLTTHPAEEKQAAISADGKWVAYAANYEGTTEAYVIPLEGGVAKRVSFENSSVRVHGWTPKGEVLYSTNNRVGPTGNWTLRTVNPDTLVTASIPLADAVEGSVDAKGEYVYFAQFGLQVSTDNARVYRGGAKGELWRYKLGSSQEAQKLTGTHQGSTRQPMAYDGRLYFVSDASGSENIWSMKADGSDYKQLTFYKDWPIRAARLHQGKIAYQLGADIYIFDISSGKSQKQSIELTSDFAQLRDKWINEPLKYLNSSNLAGDHKKVVITARGKVAIASTDKSRLVEVKTPADSRTRAAILSDDGKWVYAINDASGEMEIWQFAADGSNQNKQLTKDGYIFRWQLSLSPDGRYIAHDDQNGDLWLLDLKSGKNRKIISGGSGLDPFNNLTWSNDSNLLAATQLAQSDERNRIVLYSINEAKSQVLTSDKYNSYSPAFSVDGNWLYFLSERHFDATPRAPWGDRNMGVTFDRRSQIFAYALKTDARFPFQRPNELMPEEKSQDKNDDKKKNKNSKRKATPVDWNGVTDRLWQVPVDSGNYKVLQVNSEYLFVSDQISEPNSKPELKSIKIKPSPKLETFTKDIAEFKLSDDGKLIFVRKEGNNNANMFIVDAGAKFPKETEDSKVVTSDWKLRLSPKQEWKQMFHDAWLMHRDSLFDPQMRGVDWKAAYTKYSPLLERLTDRYELNDIFEQMMGELNALHSQVRGGDFVADSNAPQAALLGATLNQNSEGVTIEHIYKYDNEIPSQASPLLMPGVNVQEGDLIVSINGLPTKTIAAVNNALLNQAGKQILIELKRNNKHHKTVIVPTDTRTDNRLRYNDWVSENRKKVEQSKENIGYLHLYAMGSNDIADFAREFYAAYKSDGLIIDVRRNRGGNIDSWIIEKLLRKAWMFWQAPIGGPTANMQQTFRGHLVVLADQYTYSDGETFTAGIKALNIAPVIGKQTAGAGVWLRGLNSLVDGGMARVAEFPQYAMDGRWIVEGHGVEPTIEVDNLPHETFYGKDAQLEAAIEYIQKKIRQQPIKAMKPKAFPKSNAAQDILSN